MIIGNIAKVEWLDAKAQVFLTSRYPNIINPEIRSRVAEMLVLFGVVIINGMVEWDSDHPESLNQAVE